MPLETTPFDEADYLTTPERIAGFLSEADATNDPAVIRRALDVAARAIERYQARRAEAQAPKLP
jgi:DNA-binding phage protein